MLSDFLVSQIFTFLLIFCRTGTAIMLLPGFGESYVSPRVRLLFAAMFALVLVPAIQPFPTMPETVPGLVGMMGAELMVGIFIGALARTIIATLTTAGMIIAFQSSLASSVVQDVTATQGQGTTIGNLLGMAALVLMFAMDLHHLLLRSLLDSYQLFSVGVFPDVADMADHMSHTVSGSFAVALQLASPHVVIGLMLYLTGGIIARLMPNIQIFFILTAPQLLISFFVFMTTFSVVMMWYMDYFKENIGRFVAP